MRRAPLEARTRLPLVAVGFRARARRALRYAWAFPATAVGMVFCAAAMCAGARPRLVSGVVEVAGGRMHRAIAVLPQGARFAAITFGHVVIGVDHIVLGRIRAHERVHVRQYERWGVLFFPLYLASSLIQWARGRHPYLDNVFEREAYAKASVAAEAASSVVPRAPS